MSTRQSGRTAGRLFWQSWNPANLALIITTIVESGKLSSDYYNDVTLWCLNVSKCGVCRLKIDNKSCSGSRTTHTLQAHTGFHSLPHPHYIQPPQLKAEVEGPLEAAAAYCRGCGEDLSFHFSSDAATSNPFGWLTFANGWRIFQPWFESTRGGGGGEDLFSPITPPFCSTNISYNVSWFWLNRSNQHIYKTAFPAAIKEHANLI